MHPTWKRLSSAPLSSPLLGHHFFSPPLSLFLCPPLLSPSHLPQTSPTTLSFTSRFYFLSLKMSSSHLLCFFLSLCPTHTLCFSSRDPHVCFFSYLHVLLVVLSLLPFSFRSLSILKWVFPVHTGISPSRLHFLQLIVRTQTNTWLKRKGKRKCLFPSATFVNVTFHN